MVSTKVTAGPTVPVVDVISGEIREAQIFVAVLGASNYTYAEATWTQGLADWIGAHTRAFSFFDGVPALVVPAPKPGDAKMSKPESSTNKLRIYSDNEGKVYLFYEPENVCVEVKKPVTNESCEIAGEHLRFELKKKRLEESLRLEGKSEETATPQQLSNRQIKSVVEPHGFFAATKHLRSSLFEGVVGFFITVGSILFLYQVLRRTSQYFPEKLHLAFLALCAIGLAFLIYMMRTADTPNKEIDKIRASFGKYGLLFLPMLTLFIAASVFASLTLSLHNHQYVTLQPCDGGSVAEGSLLNFYLWHFFKLVPLVKLNETLKWSEPLCYEQSRVGFLILFFQVLVVVPSLSTIRFYWKNRRRLGAQAYEYVYEPGWTPGS